MHVGPKLQTNLFEVLLQWRTHQFVYAADIAKMYRQILILALRVLRQLVLDEG